MSIERIITVASGTGGVTPADAQEAITAFLDEMAAEGIEVESPSAEPLSYVVGQTATFVVKADRKLIAPEPDARKAVPVTDAVVEQPKPKGNGNGGLRA